MKSLLQKDKKKRKLIYKFEHSLFLVKNISLNNLLNNSIRLSMTLNLFNYSLNKFKTRSNNRCVMTNRKSKIHKKIKFSRLFFLKVVRSGLVSGFKKSSW